MSEAHILGRMVANGDYVSSQFVEIYENGGVFLFDEVDAADSNTLLIINSALANGHMSVPNRRDNPIAKRHKDFYCVCAANTFGKGSIEYAGRNILDDAFLDRFAGSKMLITYDSELEREICGAYKDLFRTLSVIRVNVEKYKIRRVVSTRAYVSGARALTNGHDLNEYIERFTTGWTQEEKSKALENAK
jgi:MoxR-like ATPase